MVRLFLTLAIMILLLPTASYGQDGWSLLEDPWSAARSATVPSTAEPLPQTEFVPKDTTFLDGQVEHFNWPDINKPNMGSIGFGDLLVRGQSEGGDSGGGGENLTARANDPTSSLISINMQNFFTTDSYEASGHGYLLSVLPVIPIQWSLFGFDRMINRPAIPIFGPTVDPDGPMGNPTVNPS